MPDDGVIEEEFREVVSEFHSFHVTRERDMGVLDKGFAKGCRFIATTTGVGDTPDAARAQLDQGRPTLTGYRLESS